MTKLDKFLKKAFQVPYDVFKRWTAPTWLEKVCGLIMQIASFPKLAEIVKVAYEVSKKVETEKLSGLAKKKKVVETIEEFTKLIGIKLPSTLVNFINELCALYVKLEFKF